MKGFTSELVLLGFILFQIQVAVCINCLHCENVADLSNCQTVITCSDNEVCFIEKFLSTDGFYPLYNTGCRSVEFCTLQYCNKKEYGDGNSRKKRELGEDLTLCSECCFGDSCNNKGCGYVPQLNGIPQCYSCVGVRKDGLPCTKTVDCDLKLFACSVTSNTFHANAYDLGCTYKRKQCEYLMSLNHAQQDENVKCCNTPFCNKSPYQREINKTAVAKMFSCPTDIVKPTTTPSPATTATPESTSKSTTPIPTTATHVTTPILTTTTQVTTPIPTTTTTAAKSTEPPLNTLPPVTTTCAVCSGPKFLCEKLFAPTPCPPPNNYCINTIQNHKNGTKTVERACGNFDTCYREWFLGSSDKDECRRFTGNDEQHLDFQCTFCCTTDNCNIPLHPDTNTLYQNTATTTTQLTTPIPITTTQVTTPIPKTTTQVTTPIPTTTTTTAKSTMHLPKTLPPVTTTCAVCSGPKFLCEKLFAPTPCPPPNNYCINTIQNHKDGTKTVDRACGNFDTCYREWFLGSSDKDECRRFTGNDEQHLDFQCTFCCTTDNCNIPLHADTNTLYQNTATQVTTPIPTPTTDVSTPIPSTTTQVTTHIPTTTTQVTTPFPTTTTTAAKSTKPPPKTLPPVTTTCAVCSGPKFLCEKLFAPTPCPPPNNYCINTIQNHKNGTKTVNRACGNFDTCYREWFLGSSDKDECRRFTGNDEQHLDFQCTFCCTTDNCNMPLHPDTNTLYQNTATTTTQVTTPIPTPTTQVATPIPTTTTQVTTHIPTPTTQVTTPFPTTTTIAAKSTKPPPKTLPPVTTTCAVCSGPKFLCEKLFAPTPCPPPNNYCINTIQNHKDGTKTVDRACGNFDTCYREWFLGSSDKDECRRFTGNDEQHLDFQCTFCCTTDNCNMPLHPDTNTLYQNTATTTTQLTTPIPITTTQVTTPIPTTTTQVTTPIPTTTTSTVKSTMPLPKTLPPVTTTCAVCSGPKFLCEKLFAPTPCPPPNNYCINTIQNHKDGTKTVDRACGNFDTCYREWFQGSSDKDECRRFTGNDEQHLDFQCTFCCTTDNCNIPLHPDTNTLYKNTI